MEQFDGGATGIDVALLVFDPATRPDVARCRNRGPHGMWGMPGDRHSGAIRST